MRTVGTVVRGIRTGVIKEGDNLSEVVVNSIIRASENEKFTINDRDIIAITEAVVGISYGNYVMVDDIATDIKIKFPDGNFGIVFPILSRNRFALCLKGFARGARKITIALSYPADEVGNHLFKEELLYQNNIDTNKMLTETEYYNYFGNITHEFTGVNYIDFYRNVCKEENCEVEFIFTNNPLDILKFTNNVLACDIHSRFRTKELLKSKDANVYGMDDILNQSINGSGYNTKYGLLGSNRSTEERLKLFPENGEELVLDIQNKIKELTGKMVEVMVYGDGAFKDPVGKIWELADPVVSPAYTSGLEGTPNELKLKYLSDNKFSNLNGEELNNAIKEEIRNKQKDLKGTMVTQGTTPRRLTDLIGSLCDLTSGSGDKGTPVVYIQGYFDNYAD